MSKPPTSGIVTRKLAIAAASASQRTAFAFSSRHTASNTVPASIGSQIETLSRPIDSLLLFLVRASQAEQSPHGRGNLGPQLPRHQREDAQQHHQRVEIQIACLEGTYQ